MKEPKAGLQEVWPSDYNNGLRKIRPHCHTKSRGEEEREEGGHPKISKGKNSTSCGSPQLPLPLNQGTRNMWESAKQRGLRTTKGNVLIRITAASGWWCRVERGNSNRPDQNCKWSVMKCGRTEANWGRWWRRGGWQMRRWQFSHLNSTTVFD